jgi:hypothetical protein
MSTTPAPVAEVPAEGKARRKPGPLPGPERRQYTILIDPDLGEWGKRQPGGLSDLIRRLLREEYEKTAGAPST